MRDASFIVYPEAPAVARPPLAVEFLADAPPTATRRWRIVDTMASTLGHARTRAGARAALRDLYARLTPSL